MVGAYDRRGAVKGEAREDMDPGCLGAQEKESPKTSVGGSVGCCATLCSPTLSGDC